MEERMDELLKRVIELREVLEKPQQEKLKRKVSSSSCRYNVQCYLIQK